MDAARFIIEIQHKAGKPANLRDPLAVARSFLDSHPDSAEADVLRRLIRAILTGHAPFSQADLEALGYDGARLGAALIDARFRGFFKDAEWRAALPADARDPG